MERVRSPAPLEQDLAPRVCGVNKCMHEAGARDPALPGGGQGDRVFVRTRSKIHLVGEEKESIHTSRVALGLQFTNK